MNRDLQCEKDANLWGMARPPFLSFPHKGGRDANPSRLVLAFRNVAAGDKC
jgi:hypothetical protein